MSQEILDHEEPGIKFNKFRILPLILEFTPLLIAIVGILINNESMITFGFCLISIIYVTLGWYLFKGLKFSIFNIFIATFFGNGLAVVLLGILFYIMKWDFFEEMIISGHTTLFFCFALSLIYMAIKYFTSKNKEYEFTNSQKIFSRYLFLIIIFYSTGMYSVFHNLIQPQ